MWWFFAALAASAIWAWTNVVDEDLVVRRAKDPLLLVAITGLFGGIPFFVITLTGNFQMLSADTTMLAIAVGLVALLAYWPYYRALKEEDVADIILFWNLTPVFVVIMAFVFAHERLIASQYFAIGLLVAGSMIMGYAPNPRGSSLRAYLLMAGASLLLALEVVLAKILYNNASFLPAFAYVSLTMFCGAALMMLCRTKRRQKAKRSWRDMRIYVVSELADVSAGSLKGFAVSMGSASVIQALSGVQSLFVVCIESLGIFGARVHRPPKEIVRIVLASACVVVGLVLIATGY